MILKEEDVEKPSQNITKVIDTALDKGLNTKNVSSFLKFLNISRIILSYPLADCFEFYAFLAHRPQAKHKQILK